MGLSKVFVVAAVVCAALAFVSVAFSTGAILFPALGWVAASLGLFEAASLV